MLDPVRNFAVATLTAGLASGASSFSVSSGEGSLFPAPASEGAFNLVIWNATDYADPLLDPLREILRVGALSGDAFSSVTRGQEGTADQDHNLVGKTYKVALIMTRKMIQDIDARLVDQLQGYAADSGVANAYAVTMAPAPAAYTAGMRIRFKAANANTGASTLNVNGLGAKSIKGIGGASLAASEIRAGGMITVDYDGTDFQLVIPSLTPSTVQSGAYTYATDTGSANAYTVALAPSVTAYAAGLEVKFQVGTTNTGASTLNVNGLGAKDIQIYNNGGLVALGAGDLVAGAVATVLYDGTRFLLMANAVHQGLQLISAQSFSAATSFNFQNLVAGARYRLSWEFVQNTAAGDILLTFNNDTGGNYGWGGRAESTQPNSGGWQSTGIASSTPNLQDPGFDVKATGICTGWVEFQATSADLTRAVAMGQITWEGPSYTHMGYTSVVYNGASDVTRVDISTDAGTFTGTAKLHRIW